MRLMLKGVAVAALIGTVTGCSSPFLGRNRSANQVENSPEATQTQPANQTGTLRANQPATQGQNTNQTTAQAPTATGDPIGDPADTAQAGSNQAVQALW